MKRNFKIWASPKVYFIKCTFHESQLRIFYLGLLSKVKLSDSEPLQTSPPLAYFLTGVGCLLVI